MPPPSLVVLNTMAIAWAGIAFYALHAPTWSPLLALLVSLTILTLTRHATPPTRTPQQALRARRVIVLSSLAEGLAICIGVAGISAFGRNDLWPCILAASVGAHFLPLARLLPAPRYYATAAILLFAAAIGLVLPYPTRTFVIGTLGAASLWATALLLLPARPKNAI